MEIVSNAENIMKQRTKYRDVKEIIEIEIGNQFGIKYSEIRNGLKAGM